jgi:beta-glucanase (GH16 family)
MIVVALMAICGAAGLTLAQAEYTLPKPKGPTFREEFRGKRLNAERWRTCHWWARESDGCTIESNNELQWYLPGQVRVGGQRARLYAERRATRGSNGKLYPYRSGMISSGPAPEGQPPKFAFRYGKVAMRARVPRGRGLWSAFWLLPADRDSKPEIDVMEVLGHRPDTVEMHFHYRTEQGEPRQLGHEWSGLKPGWHVFAVDWRPGRITWLVDGKERWEVTGPAVPDEKMYLIANLAVGGDWPGAPTRDTKFPAWMTIDWIRVWR